MDDPRPELFADLRMSHYFADRTRGGLLRWEDALAEDKDRSGPPSGFFPGRPPKEARSPADKHLVARMRARNVAGGKGLITMTAAGDYPGQYIAAADDWIVDRFDAIAGQLAQHLRVPVLSAGGLDDPNIMLLSLPDGAAFHVLAEQDDEDHGMHNTPEMQHLIDAHPAPARVRAA